MISLVVIRFVIIKVHVGEQNKNEEERYLQKETRYSGIMRIALRGEESDGRMPKND